MGVVKGKTYRILDPRKLPEAEHIGRGDDDERWVINGANYRVEMLEHIGKTIIAPNTYDCIYAFTWYWHPWMLEEIKPFNVNKLLRHIKEL